MIRPRGTSIDSRGAIRLTSRERRELLRLSNGKCYHCGAALKWGPLARMSANYRKDPQWFTVDHLVPVSRGGKTEPGNIVASCLRCNSEKGKLLVSEWRGPLAGKVKRPKMIVGLSEIHSRRLMELAAWAGLSRAELIRRWIDVRHEAELAVRRVAHELPRGAPDS